MCVPLPFVRSFFFVVIIFIAFLLGWLGLVWLGFCWLSFWLLVCVNFSICRAWEFFRIILLFARYVRSTSTHRNEQRICVLLYRARIQIYIRYKYIFICVLKYSKRSHFCAILCYAMRYVFSFGADILVRPNYAYVQMNDGSYAYRFSFIIFVLGL